MLAESLVWEWAQELGEQAVEPGSAACMDVIAEAKRPKRMVIEDAMKRKKRE